MPSCVCNVLRYAMNSCGGMCCKQLCCNVHTRFCCSVQMQLCCNVHTQLRCNATQLALRNCLCTLQHIACNSLQHTTTHCTAAHCVAMCMSSCNMHKHLCCNVHKQLRCNVTQLLMHIATHCVAMCMSSCVATGNMLGALVFAMCCSVLWGGYNE